MGQGLAEGWVNVPPFAGVIVGLLLTAAEDPKVATAGFVLMMLSFLFGSRD